MWRWTPVLVIVWIAAVSFVSITVLEQSGWQLHHTVGLLLLVPGLALWTVARYQHGADFTARASARRLVTTGAYRWIRHPIYVGGAFAMTGLFVFLAHPIFCLVLVVSVPMQVRRARREEQVLEAAFGDDYRTYRARTYF